VDCGIFDRQSSCRRRDDRYSRSNLKEKLPRFAPRCQMNDRRSTCVGAQTSDQEETVGSLLRRLVDLLRLGRSLSGAGPVDDFVDHARQAEHMGCGNPSTISVAARRDAYRLSLAAPNDGMRQAGHSCAEPRGSLNSSMSCGRMGCAVATVEISWLLRLR